MFRSWGPGGEVRFPDFAQFAVDVDDIYHLGKTEEEVRATYFRLMEKLKENPVTFPDGWTFNDVWFRVANFSAMYNDMSFPVLAMVWQMINEDIVPARVESAVGQLMDVTQEEWPGIPEDNSAASALAILCGDVQWPSLVNQYRQEFNNDRKQFPIFGAIGSNIWPCAFWAAKPAELPVTINGNGPADNILVLQNMRDPATPYWNGAEMRSAFGKRARLVTVDQGGHGAAYIGFNSCANDAATGFLTKGTYPSADKFCPADSAMATRSAGSPERQRAIEELYKKMR
jgi:hypothetical protein